MKDAYLVNPLIFLFCLLAGRCGAQSTKASSAEGAPAQGRVGGACDGCELIYVGIPGKIAATDTSRGWNQAGQKLVVTGKIFKLDGRTPAADVIVYYWQTDNTGYYSTAAGLHEKAKRHGHIRGWVKSDKAGNYSIHTIRPVPYPGETIPAHIHLVVKEPSIANEYYIDEILFEDDQLLTKSRRAEIENRGGNAILQVNKSGLVHKATHNITLGLNIPGYPPSGNN